MDSWTSLSSLFSRETIDWSYIADKWTHVSTCEILPDNLDWLPSPDSVGMFGLIFASVMLACLIWKVKFFPLESRPSKDRKIKDIIMEMLTPTDESKDEDDN